VANLTFDPTAAFHEYRMDLIPGGVVFYADGQQLAKMVTSFAPTEPGHMILTHWSNGNNLWSGGPPRVDAVMSVSYVKAYFNSSAPERQKLARSRCRDATLPEAVCKIPDQIVAPDLRAEGASGSGKSSAADVGFFIDQPDARAGQIFYDKNDASMFVRSGVLVYMVLVLCVVVVL
jgi:beta-glucanase (GH16 family)